MGTVPSSLLTYAAGVALRPDLIINAGTAGGFQVLDYFFNYVVEASIRRYFEIIGSTLYSFLIWQAGSSQGFFLIL